MSKRMSSTEALRQIQKTMEKLRQQKRIHRNQLGALVAAVELLAVLVEKGGPGNEALAGKSTLEKSASQYLQVQPRK